MDVGIRRGGEADGGGQAQGGQQAGSGEEEGAEGGHGQSTLIAMLTPYHLLPNSFRVVQKSSGSHLVPFFSSLAYSRMSF